MKYEECLKQIEPILKEMDEEKYGRLVALISNVKNITMDEIYCLLSLSKVVKGTSEDNLKYLPKHLEALNKTESTRVVSTKYSWIRDTMVSMQYAVESSTRFMNNFIKMESNERKNLTEIMDNFASIADSAAKIRSLSKIPASLERKKYKNKKNSIAKTEQPLDAKSKSDDVKKEEPVETQVKKEEPKKNVGIDLEKKEKKSDDKTKAAEVTVAVS